MDIANEIGVDCNGSTDHDELIYNILDKQAEVEGNKNPLGTKRRRTRIVKKDTDRVYSVNGKEGENFDLKKTRQNTPYNPTFSESHPQYPTTRLPYRAKKPLPHPQSTGEENQKS